MNSELEFELGVPLPGRVLPEHRWTRTAYEDAGSPFDWDRVFGRSAPRVVELGCGSGRYLVGSSVARPGRDHLGIDVVDRLAREAAGRADRRGLLNLRVVTGDAVTWLFERLTEDSVDEIHVYHPQPYYNPAEMGRRILTPEFLDRAWRVLRADGLFVLQTDHPPYWRYLLQAASKYFDPEVASGPWPDAPLGRTRREIIARRKGMAIRRMAARRRQAPLAMEIPRIDFDTRRPR
jgi:tRNA (guanine-N7-)-methyltransferase